jgi:hypothetical protein
LGEKSPEDLLPGGHIDDGALERVEHRRGDVVARETLLDDPPLVVVEDAVQFALGIVGAAEAAVEPERDGDIVAFQGASLQVRRNV